MKNKHQKCVFRPPNHKKPISLAISSHKYKQMFNLHFDSLFVVCSYEGEYRGHFDFFHLNLLVSNVYFWSTTLLQLNHIIVNMFSGIFIVTVNIYKKTTDILYLEVKERLRLSKQL